MDPQKPIPPEGSVGPANPNMLVLPQAENSVIAHQVGFATFTRDTPKKEGGTEKKKFLNVMVLQNFRQKTPDGKETNLSICPYQFFLDEQGALAMKEALDYHFKKDGW